MKAATFLVVDDHPVFRQGLVALINSNPRYRVGAEAGSQAEALGILENMVPDIALLDLSLGKQNGLDLVRTIRSYYPKVQILIISMYDELVYAPRALKAGARGYVMKQEASSVMIEAIKTVLAGHIYVSGTMKDRLLETAFSQQEDSFAPSIQRLSDRELEVLGLMGQGYGLADIAAELHLSVKTVNVYRDHLKEKLQLEDAKELRRYAVKWVQSQNT